MYIIYKKVKNDYIMHAYFKNFEKACKFINNLRDKNKYYIIYENCNNDNIFSFFKRKVNVKNNFVKC